MKLEKICANYRIAIKYILGLLVLLFLIGSGFSVYNGIPYWVKPADYQFWVKINNSQSQFYVYYGGNVSNSSGENVFEFFDDFEGTSLDTSKWINYDGSVTSTVSNSVADIYTTSTSGHLYANIGDNQKIMLYTKTRIGNTSTDYSHWLFYSELGITSTWGQNQLIYFINYPANQQFAWYDTTFHYLQPSDTNWHTFVFMLDRTTNTYKVKIDNNLYTIGTRDATGSLIKYFSFLPRVHMYIDYIFTTKYLTTNPTINYSLEETGNWEINGQTYTKRKLVTLSNIQWTGDMQVQLDYNKFQNANLFVGNIPPELIFNYISLVNNSVINTSNLQINVTVENISTNSNINISYSLNGENFTQFVTNNPTGTLNLNLTDGDYNITFYAWNNETNATSDTYYFTIDTTKPNITRTNISEVNSYTVNVSNLFTHNDTHEDTCYVIVENTQIGCSDEYTFNYAGNQSVFVFVNDSAGNSNNLTFYILVNPYQYVYFQDKDNNSVTNFYIDNTLYNNYFYFKLFGYYNYSDINQTFYFTKLGYTNTSFTLELTNQSNYNITYTIPFAVINISIIDREIGELLTEFAEIKISDGVTITGNTTTGNYVYSDLTLNPSEYLLEVFIEGYTTERKFFTFNNDEQLNLKVYPMNKSSTYYGVIQVIVLNQYQNRVANARIKLLEYDYDINSYKEVWEDVTNSVGEAFVPVELTQKRYIIRIIDPVSGNSFDSSEQGEVFYVDADIRTYMITEGSIIQRNLFIENVEFTSIENQTLKEQNISYIYVSYTDSTGTLDEVCFEYYKVNGLTKTKLNNLTKCITGSSGIGYSDMVNFNLSVNNYVVEIAGYKGDERILFKTYSYDSQNSLTSILDSLNISKLLILFGFILSISLLFITKLVPVGVISLILTTMLMNYLFPSIITGAISSFMLIVLLAMVYTMSRRE